MHGGPTTKVPARQPSPEAIRRSRIAFLEPGTHAFRTFDVRNLLRNLITRSRTAYGLIQEMKYVTGSYSAGERDPFEWITNPVFRKIYWTLFLGHRLPRTVEFEMNSLCNRRCAYCPVSIEPRPKGYFPYASYQKIIDELASVNFRGYIIPNFYGEPTLDKRLYKFVTYARTRLPLTTVLIHTNADNLRIEDLIKLLDAGATYIFISQHDEQPSDAIKAIMAFLSENHEYRSHVVIKNRTASDQQLTSRGGLINDDRVVGMPSYGCYRSRRATLTFNGAMVLCCEDYYEKYSFGNVIENGFLNVWKESLPDRKSIYCGEYKEPICRKCVGLDNT